MNGSIITIDERTSGIVDVFFNPPSYRHNVRQFVQNCATELGIDTSVLNLTNFVPMTLSSGPAPITPTQESWHADENSLMGATHPLIH